MDFITFIYSALAFIVTIGVLVTVHEFGHFWVARKCGVKVLRFSVGFGQPLWSRRAGPDQTEYVVAAIPLGGYVKMLDEREGDVDPAELDRSFNRKSVWRRFAIVSAGPAFNFLFAIFAYFLIYTAGVNGVKPVIGEVSETGPAYAAGIKSGDLILAVNGIETVSWDRARFALLEEAVDAEQITLRVQGRDLNIYDRVIDTSRLALLKKDQIDLMRDMGLSAWRPEGPPIISEVIEDGAAAEAGVQVDDTVVAINGQEITNADQWLKIIRGNPGVAMPMVVVRNGERQTLTLTPRSKTEGDETFGFIGVRSYVDIPEDMRREMRVVERFGPVESLVEAADKTWRMSWLTLRMLGKLVTGEASLRNLSGPITIAHYAGLSARIGIEPFLGFLAIISISLGVLNLLPVPMLDGGHLLYYLIEIFKGSPVSEETEIIGQKIGILLLVCLMSLAIYHDLLRLVG